MRAICQSEYPSPDQVQEDLTESMWEALAVAAAEYFITAPTNREDDLALVRLGLLLPSGRPTAAGYALLLRWQRTHRKPQFQMRAERSHVPSTSKLACDRPPSIIGSPWVGIACRKPNELWRRVEVDKRPAPLLPYNR